MCLQFPPLRPTIRFVVVIDVAEQQTRFGSVYDQPNIATNAHRPKIRVLAFIEFVELHSRLRGVHLQIESGSLNGFLLFAGQPSEAVSEGISDPKFHANACAANGATNMLTCYLQRSFLLLCPLQVRISRIPRPAGYDSMARGWFIGLDLQLCGSYRLRFEDSCRMQGSGAGCR